MLFADNGRRIPSPMMRVFSNLPSNYYKINQPVNDYHLILEKLKANNLVDINISSLVFKEKTTLLKNRIIDMCPFAYIRGRTFTNTFIIADEMQNATGMQFKTLLTTKLF